MFQPIKKPIDIIKQPFQWITGVLGNVIYFLLKKITHKNTLPKNVNSILVVRRNRIGDAIMTALILNSILKANPLIKITVVATSYTAAIYRKFTPSVRVLELPDKYWGSPYLLAFHPLIKALKTEMFDVAVNSSGSFSSKAIFILNLFRSRYRIAVCSKEKRFWSLFVDDGHALHCSLENTHQLIKLASIFKRAGIKLDIPIIAGAANSTGHFLLFPESNRKNSTWPMESWLQLKSKLESLGYVVSICGSKQLKSIFQQALTPNNTEQLIETVAKYGHIVCSEGGMSHLAAISKKQITVLSGVSIQHTWFPWSRDCRLIEKPNRIDVTKVDEVLAVILREVAVESLSLAVDEAYFSK